MMKLWILILVWLPGMKFLPAAESGRSIQVNVTGKVVDAQTNQALAGVHVYIEAGEEEAFSDRSGKFSFQSWKKFPLTVHAEHKDYQKQTLQVSTAGGPLEIKMKKK
jgi:CarboxypepD_reg-like domain